MITVYSLLLIFAQLLTFYEEPAFADDADAAPPESSTIRVEDRANGILPAGPWLLDEKIKEGQPVPTVDIAGSDWFFVQKSVTWTEAVLACENFSATLAVLANVNDADSLISQLHGMSGGADIIDNPANFGDVYQMEFGRARRYWIGLTDHMVEGRWMWIGIGKPLVYDNFWYPGQPSHNEPGTTTPGEHCGSLWNPGYYYDDQRHSFNDAPCTDKYYPICDRRSLEVLLATFPEGMEENYVRHSQVQV